MQNNLNCMVSHQNLRILVLLNVFLFTVTLRVLGAFNAVHNFIIYVFLDIMILSYFFTKI